MSRKKFPCPECRAEGYESHGTKCSVGRQRSMNAVKARASATANKASSRSKKKSKKTKRTSIGSSVAAKVAAGNVKRKKTPKIINEIAIVVDRSSSMLRIRNETIDAVNCQIDAIRREAEATKQETNISLYLFSSHVDQIFFRVPANKVRQLTLNDYTPMGLTSILDATGKSINDLLNNVPTADDKNTSFLVNVITDGGENDSRKFSRDDLAKLMNRVNATDRWSFIFNCPPGHERYFDRLGVPAGNVQAWTNDSVGTQKMAAAVDDGFSNYFSTRSIGGTQTKSFFQVDMSNVRKKDIKKLDDLSSEFTTMKVDKDRIEIREFVNKRLSKNTRLRKMLGDTYKARRGYYQLTKPETVQASKDIMIRDKSTNAIYGGDQARGLIGMPVGVQVRVRPGDHGNYDIFVLSTSYNRKLVISTDLLYKNS